MSLVLLTDQQYKDLVLLNVGDNGVLASPVIDSLWDKNSAYSQGSGGAPYLQYLCTWRDALDVLMGSVWRDITIRMPTRAQLSMREKFQNLKEMSAEVESLIQEFYSRFEPLTGTPVAVLTPGLPGMPNPSDPIYRGDPIAVQSGGGWPW